MPISIDNEMKTVGLERVKPIELPRVMMNIGTLKRANINDQFSQNNVKETKTIA